MSWRKITLLSVGGITVLAALLVSWLMIADLGVIKPRIEKLVTELAGRGFTIDGELDIFLGGETVIIANNVRIDNAAWAGEPHMLDVGHIELRLDGWSLIRGPIRVNKLLIDDTDVLFLESASEGSNWDLMPGQPAEGNDDDESGFGFLLQEVDLEDVRIVYSSPERSGPLDLRISRLTQQLDETEFLDLEIEATLGDRQISLQGTAGTWGDLLNQKDIDFDVSARIDTLDVVGRGHIDDLLRPSRPSLEFAIKGPDLNDLARLLEIDEEFAGDVDLDGTLTAAAEDQPMVLDLRGNLGQMQARAQGSFSDLQHLEQADLTLAAGGPDLGRLLRLVGAPRIPTAPYSIELEAERRGPALDIRLAHMEYADAEFDLTARIPMLPTIDDADIRLDIQGQLFERFREVTGLPGKATGPYRLSFELKDSPDGPELVELDLQSTLVTLTASGTIGDAPDYLGSRFRFEGEAESLAKIAEAYELPVLPVRPLSLSGAAEIVNGGVRTTGPVRVRSRDIELDVEGLLSLTPILSGTDFRFSATVPDLALAVADFIEANGIPSQPLRAEGRIQLADQAVLLSGAQATIGSTVVDLVADILPQEGLAGSTLSLAVNGTAIEELTAPFDSLNMQPGPFELSALVEVTPTSVRIDDLAFIRQRGSLRGGLEFFEPFSGREVEFDLKGRGDDLNSVLGPVKDFQPASMPFSLEARGSNRARLLTLNTLDFNFGRASATASGTVDLEELAGNTQFALITRIPNLAELGRYRDRAFNEQGFNLDANVSVNRRSRTLVIENLKLQIDDSDISGFVQIQAGDTPELSVRIHSDALSYAPILEEAEIEYDPAPEFEDGRLIPDIPIPFELMRRVNAIVDVDIAELERGLLSLTSLKLVSELRDGNLAVTEFGFRGPKGWLQATGSLSEAEGEGKAEFALMARDFSMAFASLNADLSASMRFDINLASSGNDLRAIAGNLNGVLYARLNDLVVADGGVLTRFYGDVLGEIISVINPFAKTSTHHRLDCVVAPLEFVNGRVRTAPDMLLRTDKLRIASDATVDLKTEKLNMQFNSTPRSGITISAGELFNPYVKVVGTLASPRLAVDQQGVLLSGGAAVATGGLSVLAQAAWRRLARDGDPCQTLEDESIEALGSRFVDLTPSALH